MVKDALKEFTLAYNGLKITDSVNQNYKQEVASYYNNTVVPKLQKNKVKTPIDLLPASDKGKYLQSMYVLDQYHDLKATYAWSRKKMAEGQL